MPDETPSSSTLPQGDLAVSISVVSPSVSVNAPLNFPDLPPSTTIAQVKQKIRDALASKPSNNHQRLIHQGKLLAREQDTLVEVFGEQKLRESDHLIFHLVIREPPSTNANPSPSQAAPRGQSPARNPTPGAANPLGASPQASPHHHPHPHAHHHVFQPGRFGRPPAMNNHAPFPNAPFGMPAPPAGPMQAQAMAQQQDMLQNYMNHFNQRAGSIPGQPQMVATTVHTGPGLPANLQFPPGNNGLGRNSPHLMNQPQPFVQQGIGPNGEVYRVTVNSTIIGPNGPIAVPTGLQQANMGPPAPGGPFSTNDVQNILRTADASEHASSIMANAMHRSASGASLPNLATGSHRQPIQTPGVTVPRRPGSTVPVSRTATPDATRTPSLGSTTATQVSRPSSTPQPEVYILNSPQGPRALLINGPSDMYFTPAARIPAPQMFPGFASPWGSGSTRAGPGGDPGQPHAQSHNAAAPAQQQAPQQGNIRVGLYQRPLQQAVQQQQQALLQPLAPGAAAMHPANPEGGVAGALLAALWPHVWLMVRLTLFVWWFTSADTTWTRWLTVLSIAVAIFVVNTGILNNIAHDVFNPFRQHLEGLIPFGALEENRNRRENPPAADAQPGQAGPIAPAAQAVRQQGEPDPAQAAARLIEQRRVDNGNWLLDQVRRLERAGLLFLASIAPGVAERHIANMEAAERAERAERERQEVAERTERERREGEERAAADAASASAGGTAENVEAEAALGDQANGEAPASGAEAAEQQQQIAPAAQ